MLVLKGMIAIAFLAAFASLVYTVYLGIKLRQPGSQLFWHQRSASRTILIFVVALVFTEVAVRLAGGVDLDYEFLVHLSLAVPFLVSMVILRFWFNGIRFPGLHRWIAYVCACLGLGTFITGLWLLSEL